MAQRRRVVLALAAVVVAIGLAGLAGIAFTSVQSPEQPVQRYIEQVMRADSSGALAVWAAPMSSGNGPRGDALSRRRDLVTAELIAARPLVFRIIGVELWRTCCEPGLAERPQYAGLARIRVALELPSGAREYFFDVRKEPDCCTNDPFDLRVRSWVLRDVYPTGKLPIELPWVYDPARRDTHVIVGLPEP